jgi:hypothetical protein
MARISDSNIKACEDWVTNILPDPDTHDYAMKLLARSLRGDTPDIPFPSLEGDGDGMSDEIIVTHRSAIGEVYDDTILSEV